MLIFLRVLYRLYLIGAALGLWGWPDRGSLSSSKWERCTGDSCCGAALVQGRRFYQEDRAVVLSGNLPPSTSQDGSCSPAATSFLYAGGWVLRLARHAASCSRVASHWCNGYYGQTAI